MLPPDRKWQGHPGPIGDPARSDMVRSMWVAPESIYASSFVPTTCYVTCLCMTSRSSIFREAGPAGALSEIRNATVHGWICTALARTASGYRLYWAIYVLPVSWRTRPYLMAITPFRRILYPAMLRRIRRAWVATYGFPA